MKRVLFVLQGIGFGGSMTSLLNLLSFIHKDELDIDVLFMDRYGELLEPAQDVANVLAEDKFLQAVSTPRPKLKELKRYDLILLRAILAVIGKVSHKTTSDIAYTHAAPKYDDKYDCVVAYQESIATSFVAEIKCKRKIAWVHNDYENVKRIYRGSENLRRLYSAFDKVICVSKAGRRNFQEKSGLPSEQIDYVYNALRSDSIRSKAKVPVELVLDEKKNKAHVLALLENRAIKFVSSGRFAEQKRFDRVIKVAKRLKEDKIDFSWIIVGNGDQFERIEKAIISENISDVVALTGGLSNPFPVVNACDVFVLTSQFEAHPMVANEALLLGKPVITTNYESASEVVENGVNGLICEMSVNGIYNSCKELVINQPLMDRLSKSAQKFEYQNDCIIDKVLRIVGE